MRIAFSGSGGTGKTRLLTEINKELELPVIGEGIREWLEEHGFDDFKDMEMKDVVQMQEDTLKRKTDIESTLGSFMSDRTTVDNLSYALRWIGSVDGTGTYESWMAQYLMLAMNHAEANYDLIFLLPWGELELEDDGTRSTKTWYQYLMQSIIERHIYMLNRPMVYEVMSVPLEDRKTECMKIIRSLEMNPELGLQ
jgi:nicotinamide riboside kinase